LRRFVRLVGRHRVFGPRHCNDDVAAFERIAASERVFTTNGESSVSGWSRAKAKLDEFSGVKDWRIHDLRRTVATGLQRLGVNLQTIETVLGHTSGSRSGVVGVYQRHSFDAEKRAALSRTGKLVMGILALIAGFENDIRHERQMDGIAKARDRGVKFGRKPQLLPGLVKEDSNPES
jgi:integrase-like protein/resolvase-like protein